MRKIVWSKRAIRHLIAIEEYIAEDKPDAAERIAARIIEAVERLAEHPESGRPGRISGTRELIVDGTPYIIPYRVRRNSVELIAVFHGRQRWPKRL